MSPKSATAKLFRNGRSQAVRLPKDFQLPGDRARVRHAEGGGVVLEPILGVDEWFAEMDANGEEPFMATGRNQPPMPVRDDFA